MELPIGKIAEELILELEEEIRVRQREIERYRGSIEGIKYFVASLKERATDIQAGTSTGGSVRRETPYVHPSIGTQPSATGS